MPYACTLSNRDGVRRIERNINVDEVGEEWRAKLNSAGTWWEFQEIDIQEPIPSKMKKEPTKKEDDLIEKEGKNPPKFLHVDPDIRCSQSYIELEQYMLSNRKSSNSNYYPPKQACQTISWFSWC